MLQALNIKNAATKAPQGVKGASQGEAAIDAETALGTTDFASELMASLSAAEVDGEVKTAEVKAVEVSPEQMLEQPSSLIQSMPTSGQSESVSPKVFDPALTQDVDKLTQPKSVQIAPAQLNNPTTAPMSDLEVLKLAQGEIPAQATEGSAEVKSEIAQAMLKTPQVNHSGRAPAIEFAQSEIDPQLMNMEDFLTQKNLVTKKNAGTQAYGMKAQAQIQAQEAALENGLKSTQVIQNTGAVEGQSQAPVNSQQFILNMMNGESGAKSIDAPAPATKVFDMSHIKTSNSNEIMNQITNYVIQAKAAKEPTVNMRVNHEDLGMIDITVQKTAIASQDAVAINIGTHSADGKTFFQQNSKELFSQLSQAGINVSDIKVDIPSQTAKNDFDMGQQSNGRQSSSGQDKNFGSEQNQRRHESDRRQNLWDLLKDKEAA